MIKFDELLVNFFETLKKGFLTWIAWMKKVEELKDLGCSVRGRFYDLAWSKPVLRAPAVHGVSSKGNPFAGKSKSCSKNAKFNFRS